MRYNPYGYTHYGHYGRTMMPQTSAMVATSPPNPSPVAVSRMPSILQNMVKRPLPLFQSSQQSSTPIVTESRPAPMPQMQPIQMGSAEDIARLKAQVLSPQFAIIVLAEILGSSGAMSQFMTEGFSGEFIDRLKKVYQSATPEEQELILQNIDTLYAMAEAQLNVQIPRPDWMTQARIVDQIPSGLMIDGSGAPAGTPANPSAVLPVAQQVPQKPDNTLLYLGAAAILGVGLTLALRKKGK